MSRIGKLPVTIPDKVQATIADGAIRIAGPKGELTQPFLDGVEIAVEDQQIVVRCAKPDDRIARSRHGLMRTLLANMVTGVTKGFERVLEIHGVGFRAELEGQDLVLSLGFPEPKRFPLPAAGVGEQSRSRNIWASPTSCLAIAWCRARKAGMAR